MNKVAFIFLCSLYSGSAYSQLDSVDHFQYDVIGLILSEEPIDTSEIKTTFLFNQDVFGVMSFCTAYRDSIENEFGKRALDSLMADIYLKFHLNSKSSPYDYEYKSGISRVVFISPNIENLIWVEVYDVGLYETHDFMFMEFTGILLKHTEKGIELICKSPFAR